jgi:hypothetical protein
MTEPIAAEQSKQIIKGKHLIIAAIAALSILSGVMVNIVNPLYLIVGVVGIVTIFLMFKFEFFWLGSLFDNFPFPPGRNLYLFKCYQN